MHPQASCSQVKLCCLVAESQIKCVCPQQMSSVFKPLHSETPATSSFALNTPSSPLYGLLNRLHAWVHFCRSTMSQETIWKQDQLLQQLSPCSPTSQAPDFSLQWCGCLVPPSYIRQTPRHPVLFLGPFSLPGQSKKL